MENRQQYYKEYLIMSDDQRYFGKKIEEKVIPLSGKFLDYLEIIFSTLSMNEPKHQDLLKEIRSKVLRDSNDAVRKLLADLSEFSLSRINKEIIKFKNK